MTGPRWRRWTTRARCSAPTSNRTTASFTYKRRSVDVRTVAEELGVRYVLEGSIRRSANRIRVTARLIEALTGNHLWAEKYDRVPEDIFAVQEELTQAIVAAIAPQIDSSEVERVRAARPGSLSAYELAVRGAAAAQLGFSDADIASRDTALRFAREALAIDPRSAVALRTIAFAQWQHLYFHTAESAEAAIREGIDATRRAIAIDHDDHVALRWKGALLVRSGQHAAGLVDIRRAHELNPNDALTLSIAGPYASDPQIGIQYATQALRLSPRDPARFILLNLLGWAHFSGRNYASGVDWAERSVGESPKFPASHLCVLLNAVGLGQIERARAAFQVWKELAPAVVEERLQGEWLSRDRDFTQRATRFLRIAAGLDEPGASPG
jgi:adenylate cyclase